MERFTRKSKLGEAKSYWTELEPLKIRRIKDSFDVGLSFSGKGSVEEMEIELIENRKRPFSDLLLEDCCTGTEAMEAKKSRFCEEFLIASHDWNRGETKLWNCSERLM